MSISLVYHQHNYKHISPSYNITLAGLRLIYLHLLKINLSAQWQLVNSTHLVIKCASIPAPTPHPGFAGNPLLREPRTFHAAPPRTFHATRR